MGQTLPDNSPASDTDDSVAELLLQSRVDDTHRNLLWITPVVFAGMLTLLLQHIIKPGPTAPHHTTIWLVYLLIYMFLLIGAAVVGLLALWWSPKLGVRVRFGLSHVVGTLFTLAATALTIADLKTGGVDISAFVVVLLVRAVVFRSPRTYHTIVIAISTIGIVVAQIIGWIDVEWFVLQGVLVVALLAWWLTWIAESNYERAIRLRSELATRNQELVVLTLHDPLTGLHNRRAFREHLEMSVDRCNRYGAALSLVILDIDYFKRVNDAYGHAVGDTVLQQTAQILTTGTRKSDLVARFGGEEFIIIMSNAGLEIAFEISERLRVAMKSHKYSGTNDSITASFGIAEYRPNGESIDQFISRADTALYTSKDSGRNRSTMSR